MLLRDSKSAVDLGTGGGEVLGRIADGVHFARLTATEQWPPNARLAYERLRPLGIATVWCEAEGARMPFRPVSLTWCSTATKRWTRRRSTVCFSRAGRC